MIVTSTFKTLSSDYNMDYYYELFYEKYYLYLKWFLILGRNIPSTERLKNIFKNLVLQIFTLGSSNEIYNWLRYQYYTLIKNNTIIILCGFMGNENVCMKMYLFINIYKYSLFVTYIIRKVAFRGPVLATIEVKNLY